LNPQIQAILDKAAQSLAAAKLLLDQNYMDFAASRAYYSMFYAVLGLFLRTNITPKTSKHSGIISMFDQVFILSGKMDKQFSKSLHKMFNARQVADYKELVEVTPEEADESVEAARKFIEEIKKVISTR